MKDLQLPACSPEILSSRPLKTLDDLRQHTLLHSSTTRSAWTQWLTLAGNPALRRLTIWSSSTCICSCEERSMGSA